MYFVDKIMSMHRISNPDFLSLWEKHTLYATILTSLVKSTCHSIYLLELLY